MHIVRDEPSTGGPNRTSREEMAPLLNGPGTDGNGANAEPEDYVDVSPSEGWPWNSDPSITTWQIQMASVKAGNEAFAALDSQAASEQARAGGDADEEDGGVATYPFSDRYLPLSDQRDDEGELIIDLAPGNFDKRWAHFLSMYPDYFTNGVPVRGGTRIMTAVQAGDRHFMGEFGSRALAERPSGRSAGLTPTACSRMRPSSARTCPRQPRSWTRPHRP